jgi:preprotein translocase subunit SecD
LFFDASGNQIEASEVLRDDRPYSTPIIRGDDLKPTTQAGFDRDNSALITFDLQSKAAQRFGQVTAQNVGRYMPIFLDERCISAPVIRSAITGGSGQISGGFANIQEAQALASLLNSGALPAPLDVIENRTVSATLGVDSLNQSLYAGMIGIAAVMIFMIAFYRLPGLLANVALVIYCLLNLAAFILMGATLTLPGIAGFLLALAMSLDTNILVFERLKEEMAIQPTFAAALRAAFSRAWTAILDSHVTTLCAAAVLFYLGTGPVKGFALTLAVGVLLSLFSAISITRLFMWSIAGAGEKNRNLFAGAVPSKATLAAQKQ